MVRLTTTRTEALLKMSEDIYSDNIIGITETNP